MSRAEVVEETFTYFDEREETLIEAWLRDHGETQWGRPSMCGACCGIYDDEYWVCLSVVAGRAFNRFAAANKIDAYVREHGGNILIGDPNAALMQREDTSPTRERSA